MLCLQPFSQKSRTATVAKEFQIGLCGVAEADWELFCNCWSAGFLGERLYGGATSTFFKCPPPTWEEDLGLHEEGSDGLTADDPGAEG